MPSGRIKYDGLLYDSPSAAANAALGRNCNGWVFGYARIGGEYVPLKSLRCRAAPPLPHDGTTPFRLNTYRRSPI